VADLSRKVSACLITPGHIAANPRLVKEAMALTKAGVKVHIVFTQYVGYLVEHDREILDKNPGWTYEALNWTGNTFFSRCIRIIGGLLRKLPVNNIRINRNFYWQLRKAVAYPAHIYIAHNPGSIPIAVEAARRKKVKCGFDAEDFHRYEMSDDPNNPDVQLKLQIENANVTYFDYITAASPLIAEKYSRLFNKNVTTVLNVFPRTAIEPVRNDNGPLKLFWFSQTIGPKRGLETVIEALSKTSFSFELHLLGFIKDEYDLVLKQLFESYGMPAENIIFHHPLPADDIFPLTAQFDIGLATEMSIPLNRDICLTNKIFTYIQCGLAVAATGTSAQKKLIDMYPQAGKLYNDTDQLAALLTAYDQNRELLYQAKKAAYDLGQQQLNWEVESEKLVNVILPVLATPA